MINIMKFWKLLSNDDIAVKGVFDTLEISRARGYKTFFMLNSIEHEIFPAHTC